MKLKAEYKRFGRMMGRRRRQRGSTILLVITILSLLALLAVTMTFTSQLEISASNNFSIGIQNRIAALTSVEAIGTRLNATLPAGPTSPLDLTLNEQFFQRRPGQGSSDYNVASLMAMSPNKQRRRDQIAADDGMQQSQRPIFSPLQRSGTGDVIVLDASARVNLNAASEAVLADFFNEVAAENGLPQSGAAIARAIAAVRLGADGAPGKANTDDDYDSTLALKFELPAGADSRNARVRSAEQALQLVRDNGSRNSIELNNRRALRHQLVFNTDEADEYIADIRLPAFGDDVRFGSVQDLLDHRQIRSAGLSEALLAAAAPHLTVHSTSVSQRIHNNESKPLVDINRATAEEIYAALKELYGATKNDVMLRQFAVNVVDARDFDDVPTVLKGSDVDVYGIERTPFITEIYADALTLAEEDDDGQFIEIYNPWNKEIDVTGWHISGPGGVFPLRGKIAPKGFLILTDDVDNSLESTEHIPGTGSLYDIFKVLPDNRQRVAVNIPHFTIPDSGTVEYILKDASGNNIDVFRATIDPRDKDSLYSWQRDNWMVRQALRRHATPFLLPPALTRPEAGALAVLENYPPNGPFVDIVDLFQVSAAFADSKSGAYNPWGFPLAISPNSASSEMAELARHSATIDARVLDLFNVEFRTNLRADFRGKSGNQDETLEPAEIPAEFVTRHPSLEPKELQAFVANNFFAPHAGLRHGKINLNTATEMALASLPGVDRQAARRVVDRRQQLIGAAQEGQPEDAITYHTLSDVLVDDELWGQSISTAERLQQFRQLLPHIALNTRSFILVSQPRMETGTDPDLAQATRVEALVAIDRNTAEIVYWRQSNQRQSFDVSTATSHANASGVAQRAKEN